MDDRDLTIGWIGNAAIAGIQFGYAIVDKNLAMAGRALHNGADAALMRMRQIARRDSSNLSRHTVNGVQVGMGSGEIGLGYAHLETAHDDEFELISQLVSASAVFANAYFLRLHLKYHKLSDLVKNREIAHISHVTTDFLSELSHFIGLGISSNEWQGVSEVIAGDILAIGGIVESSGQDDHR